MPASDDERDYLVPTGSGLLVRHTDEEYRRLWRGVAKDVIAGMTAPITCDCDDCDCT